MPIKKKTRVLTNKQIKARNDVYWQQLPPRNDEEEEKKKWNTQKNLTKR